MSSFLFAGTTDDVNSSGNFVAVTQINDSERQAVADSWCPGQNDLTGDDTLKVGSILRISDRRSLSQRSARVCQAPNSQPRRFYSMYDRGTLPKITAGQLYRILRE